MCLRTADTSSRALAYEPRKSQEFATALQLAVVSLDGSGARRAESTAAARGSSAACSPLKSATMKKPSLWTPEASLTL